jgi:amidohydrolase
VNELVRLGRRLWSRAEPGFHEHRTHGILYERFEKLGFVVHEFAGIPGFAAAVDGSPTAKRMALIADMDGLPVGEGGRYGHFCGHHVQLTALYGTALTLHEASSPALADLCFAAIPAEEYVDLDKREALRAAGTVQAFSGKQELLRRGFFSGFEAVVATHSAALDQRHEGAEDALRDGSKATRRAVNSVLEMNGFDVLRFRFRGTSAHAGSQPHLGRSAQNAAALFLQACAFLREHFREDRHIRIHPVMRLRPGQAINFVPDLASVETYVRAVDSETIDDTVDRLQRAAAGCARALGVALEQERLPGYAPFRAAPELHRLVAATARELDVDFVEEAFSAASSDVGDVSQVKPCVMVGLPGSNGRFHSPEFRIEDEEAAYVFPARFLSRFLERALREFPGEPGSSAG